MCTGHHELFMVGVLKTKCALMKIILNEKGKGNKTTKTGRHKMGRKNTWKIIKKQKARQFRKRSQIREKRMRGQQDKQIK